MSRPGIHSSSIVEKGAEIGKDVAIGPFCVIGPNVQIGDRCRLFSHVQLSGHTKLGSGNEIHPFASIGAAPQDLKYRGGPTRVEIKNNNVFREYVSIHRGTEGGGEVTSIGSGNLFMNYVHLGHDAQVGDDNIIVNSNEFGGHVVIENQVVMGGKCSVAQFITIGEGSYLGGGSVIDRDIPPFFTAYGNRVRLKGINIVGMRRRGHSKKAISDLVDFYRTMEASPLSPRAFVEDKEVMSSFNKGPFLDKGCQFYQKK